MKPAIVVAALLFGFLLGTRANSAELRSPFEQPVAVEVSDESKQQLVLGGKILDAKNFAKQIGDEKWERELDELFWRWHADYKEMQ